MKSRTILVLSVAALVASGAAFAGSITGKVTYDDKVPKLRPLSMDADPDCAKKHDGPVYPDVLVLGEGNTMANIFVQVTGVPEKAYPTPSEKVVIDQNGCQYLPHVVGVMTGQTLQFRNSDGILHNVHLLPEENREQNIGMPASLTEKDTSFTKPEPAFPVKCDVHPWMKAYVAVMSHPYFDVTAEDGVFEIKDVPAGTYEVVAWHERLGTQKATVTVGADGATTDFSFKTP